MWRVLSIFFVLFFLQACGSGVEQASNQADNHSKHCPAEQLMDSREQCINLVKVDYDLDEKADGLDLNSDQVIDLLFTTEDEDGYTGLDVNGDGQTDYYLQKTSDQTRIVDANNNGAKVLVVVRDENQVLLGLDENSDGVVDDDRLAQVLQDEIVPQTRATIHVDENSEGNDFLSGTYQGGQILKLHCQDNYYCSAIAYQIFQVSGESPSQPDFEQSQIILAGVQATLALNTRPGSRRFILKYQGIDALGNRETLHSIDFALQCPNTGELTDSDGRCVSPRIVSRIQPRGMDLINNNPLPELRYVEPNQLITQTPFGTANVTGIDISGDQLAEFYLIQAENQPLRFNHEIDASGGEIFLVRNEGILIGLDFNNDKLSDNNLFEQIRDDQTIPTASIMQSTGSNEGGSLNATANQVHLRCEDNVVCSGMVFTVNGADEPDFGVVRRGISQTIDNDVQIPLKVGENIIRLMVRDAAGLQSEILEKTFHVGCSEPGKLLNNTDTCSVFSEIDMNGDLLADGIDLDANQVPELLYVPPIKALQIGGGTRTGIDINADAVADYFLLERNGYVNLVTNHDCLCENVKLILNQDGELLGLDNNSDNQVDDNRLGLIHGDAIAPVIQFSASGGTYASGAFNNIQVSCVDNTACNGIAYRLDGLAASFGDSTNNTIVTGRSATIPVSEAATDLALSVQVRDAKGNVSGDNQNYVFGCSNAPQAVVVRSKGLNIQTAMSDSPDGIPYFEVPTKTPLTFRANIQSDIANGYTWRYLPHGSAPVDITLNYDAANSRDLAIPSIDIAYSFDLELTLSNSVGCQDVQVFRLHAMDRINNALFVDGQRGVDTNSGTRWQPLATINHALTTAEALDAGADIYIAADDRNTRYTLTIDAITRYSGNIGMYGGYDELWRRDVGFVNTVDNQHEPGNKTVILLNQEGLFFTDITSPLTFSGLDLRVHNSDSNGRLMRALNIRNSSAMVTISDNALTVSGNNKSTGRSGNAHNMALNLQDIVEVVVSNNFIHNGDTGDRVNTVSSFDLDLDGWAGSDASTTAPGLMYSRAGYPASTRGLGGGKGATPQQIIGEQGETLDGSCNGTVTKGGNSGVSAPNSPGDGGPGQVGAAGLSGDDATIAGKAFNSFDEVALRYVTATGQEGGAGGFGCGGGGGGGGGAISGNVFNVPGGHGGSGGGGAKGGYGGSGGLGGFANFALTLIGVENALIENNYLTTGRGGHASDGKAG
ncbi:MAG: hypothetical protein OEZ58_14200, partial [Gammaproteobacteria bacterium]|nr:hypothetical protein [Gammaproteobacteria bacterium]